MNVQLLRCTHGSQELVAMAAKLCYSNSDLKELQKGIEEKDQSRFINNLVEMGHLSPVEHASYTFIVEGVSRALLAQITRHRIASFSVRSQRYCKENNFNYITPPRIKALGLEAIEVFKKQMETIQGFYNYWLDKLGNAGESSNEDARFVLPNATETKFVVTMNARQLLHFFTLRCCSRAQWEIRTLANKMLCQAKEAAPIIFKDAGPACKRGPCPEGKMSCKKVVD